MLHGAPLKGTDARGDRGQRDERREKDKGGEMMLNLYGAVKVIEEREPPVRLYLHASLPFFFFSFFLSPATFLSLSPCTL